MSFASKMLYVCVISTVLTVTMWITNSNVAGAQTWHEYIYNKGTSKCLAVLSANLNEPVVQEPCANVFGQHWSLSTIDANGTWQLWNPEVDLCAAITGLDNFSPVVMRSCDDPSTHWHRRTVSVQPHQVVTFNLLSIDFIIVGYDWEGLPIYSNACLDLENGDPSNGVPLQMWACNFQTNNQMWVSQDVFE